jgi:hypothetical protein
VIQEEVSILRILPQRLRYFLKASSSILSEEKINLLKQTAHQAVVSASEKRSAE